MDTLLTSLALLLPVLLGGLWLNLLVPRQVPARTALVWGNGSLIGLLLIPQFMWVQNALGLPLSFTSTALLAGALIALAAILHLLRRQPATPIPLHLTTFSSLRLSHQILFVLLLALIALRCTTLGLEILWRPLFPWDATMHWATKARVWFEFNHMVPFVENSVWLSTGGEGVFTDRNPHYPHTVPLLQVWMNLAIDRWDESLMNLPWLLCLIALGGAFYSQLRVSGADPLLAIGFTYLLLSMPLVNIHVALAGYADLFLGAAYCAALMAFHNWATKGWRWQGVLAIVFALSCMLIKNEGIPWAATFLPAILLVLVTRQQVAKLVTLISLGLVFLAIVIYKNPIVIAGLLRTVTDFHPDALAGTIQTVWLHDNLHLWGYLLLLVIPFGLTVPGAFTRTYMGICVAQACAVAMFLFLFLFTVFGAGAAQFTGVGRLCIQLAPGLLFLSAMLCNDILTHSRLKQSEAGLTH